MAVLRLFAAARTAAGTGRDRVPGATVADVLSTAVDRYGDEFQRVLPSCQVWLNGEPTTDGAPVTDDDEIGVLPPVSGGAR
ncbi:MAG: hypothetical protein JWM05_2431 [Acidimicrobiales bacterium]|nr:hypothetical protein [Acidimicrobiales bacterium]